MSNELENGIAVIGMAGRFPGAGSTDQFWLNLEQGRESVTFFSEEELKAAHVGEELLNSANYVKASTLLENVDRFDAAFFGITQREAMVLDPQQRFFLECSWEAFENAGYVPDRYPGLIGVYAGASLNTYMMYNLACRPMYLTTPEGFQALIGNEKDYLATRIAYKFNLRGPAVTVQTACSTSLAAVHMACQSLHLGECDMALAGGVSIKIPQAMGYFHQDGMPFSKDGHCRAFDACSSGTVFGSGAGVVLLRRLEDAVEANDDILAVIKASSMNNDGSSKVGFTAPSSQGQSDVISQTLSIADISPETITYIEAHGTGTPLGDPIEIEALTEAYSGGTDKKGYCAIGSVKTNVGHLETASGVAGLIKVVQMLRHGRLVPSLNYDTPNPQIHFEDTPFFVNRETREWPKSDKHPRRAAISSFGMGGTNVHAILEEAPEVREQKIEARPYALLTLSSRSRKGLNEATEALRVWLNEHPQADLGRVAATLQLGRKAFEHRRTLVCKDLADAVRVLDTKAPDRVLTYQAQDVRPVAFMFAGGGAQYAGMTADLYRGDKFFAAIVDECALILKPLIGSDIRALILAAANDGDAMRRLQDTDVMFTSLFTVQYAMARLLHSRGVHPASMIGHSNGEYVAACLAGVMDLHTALNMVAARATLMLKMSPGEMIVLPLPEEEVVPLLQGTPLSIATDNSPKNTVVAGAISEIAAFRKRLKEERDIDAKNVHINAGLHSYLTDDIRQEFVDRISGFELNPPQIPFVSSVTGEWIKPSEATDPQYWACHLRQTVRFRKAIATLMESGQPALLDMGPGQVVSALARQNMGARQWDMVNTVRQLDQDRNDLEHFYTALGRLWMLGCDVNWASLYNGKRPRPLQLPTYVFQRKRYWIDAPTQEQGGSRGMNGALYMAIPEMDNDGETGDNSMPGRPALMVEYVAPTDECEKRIAAIWRRFFGYENIGIHDNFIELGGTSLLATEVTGALKREFGVDLGLNTFLKSGTIHALAKEIKTLGAERDPALSQEILSLVERLSSDEVAEMLNDSVSIDQPLTLIPRSSYV